MGLDQYLRRVRKVSATIYDGQIQGCLTTTESWDLTYWRKDYDIHEIMELFWLETHEEAQSLNCQTVNLSGARIRQILRTLKEFRHRIVFYEALDYIKQGWDIEYSCDW